MTDGGSSNLVLYLNFFLTFKKTVEDDGRFDRTCWSSDLPKHWWSSISHLLPGIALFIKFVLLCISSQTTATISSYHTGQSLYFTRCHADCLSSGCVSTWRESRLHRGWSSPPLFPSRDLPVDDGGRTHHVLPSGQASTIYKQEDLLVFHASFMG